MRVLRLMIISVAAAASPLTLAFAPLTTRRAAAAASRTAERQPLRPASRSGAFFGVDGFRSDPTAIRVEACRGGVGTALGMYNLPPSGGGGGGGGPGNQLKDILPGVLTILGLIAFFASPLGSVFFFVTNSLLAVAFLSPLVLLVGFQLWQFFNTTEGPCPSCGAPIRTFKDDGGNPTICFNCGSLVRTSLDGDGLELCNNPETMFSQDGGGAFGGGLFEDLFGAGGGGGYGGAAPGDVVVEVTEETRKDKARRQRTVIDVDVEVDK